MSRCGLIRGLNRGLVKESPKGLNRELAKESARESLKGLNRGGVKRE